MNKTLILVALPVFALLLVALDSRAAPSQASSTQVELVFTDGSGAAARQTRYKLPLPAEPHGARLHVGNVSVKVNARKDGRGQAWLEYEVERRSPRATPVDVSLSGTLPLAAGRGSVVIGELQSSADGPSVTVELGVAP